MDAGSRLWEWLEASQGRGIVPGLERMERLLTGLGNPEKHLRCLHVAGTNGKGSVCAFAESILLAAGHRVGLYTSPHLVAFPERIRINGVAASLSEIEGGITRLLNITGDWPEEERPTYFELVTALAMDLFARAGCDVVVLETGLGGRLDATNTAPKIACAITPISLDHTEWLGGTLTEIAGEKAGILRTDVPVVIAQQPAEAASALHAVVEQTGAIAFWSRENHFPKEFKIGLAGSHQRSNAALALDLLDVAGLLPSEECVRKGLAEVSWPGRFQRLTKKEWNAELVLDGAHNLHAVTQLLNTWREEFGEQRCRLIFGAVVDKKPIELLEMLKPLAEEVYLLPVASPRSFHPQDYPSQEGKLYRKCQSLGEAFEHVFPLQPEPSMTQRSPVLLAGSLYLVGEALALLSGREFPARSQ